MHRPTLHAAFSAVAVALVAAAIGNPLVESLSNSGLFGVAYLDNNHSSAVPVLVMGTILCGLFLAMRVREAIARDMATALARDPSSGILAFVIGAHFAILYAMEWSESAFGGAAPDAGWSWLGGPLAFALLAHIAICLLCVIGARRLMRALLGHAIAAVHFVRDLLLVARSREALTPVVRRAKRRMVRCYELVVANRLHGRAPPLPPAFAIPR